MRSDFPIPFARFLTPLMGRYTRSRQVALLWVLAAAVEKQLPLAPLIDAYSDDTRGPWKSRARDLAHLLRTGTPLPAALDSVPGVLPRSAVLAAHVGAQTGTLGPALRAEANALFSDDDGVASPSMVGNLFYFVIMLSILTSIVSFLMYFIVPKFKAIFMDFGVELPEITQRFIRASDFFIVYSLVIMPMIVVLSIAMVWAGLHLTAGQLMSVGGAFSRVYRNLAVPGILRNLSVVIAAGRPVASALSTLAAFHPVPPVRRRLLRADEAVEQGADSWLSLQQVGLLDARQVAILQSAQRAGNLPWALNLLADRTATRLEYRLRAVLELFRPCVVLVLGALVGIFVVSMFMPLLKLINSLS